MNRYFIIFIIVTLGFFYYVNYIEKKNIRQDNIIKNPDNNLEDLKINKIKENFENKQDALDLLLEHWVSQNSEINNTQSSNQSNTNITESSSVSNISKTDSKFTTGHQVYNVYIDVDANNNNINTGTSNNNENKPTQKPYPPITNVSTKPTEDCPGRKFRSKNSLTDNYDYIMVDDYKWMIPRQYKSDNRICMNKKKNNSIPSATLTDGVPITAFEYAKYGQKIPRVTFRSNYSDDKYP